MRTDRETRTEKNFQKRASSFPMQRTNAGHGNARYAGYIGAVRRQSYTISGEFKKPLILAHFLTQSVQSIIGATENLCANILQSFRFYLLTLAVLWADGNPKQTAKAFSFLFKRARQSRRIIHDGLIVTGGAIHRNVVQRVSR